MFLIKVSGESVDILWQERSCSKTSDVAADEKRRPDTKRTGTKYIRYESKVGRNS
jgi:hypothetical protein